MVQKLCFYLVGGLVGLFASCMPSELHSDGFPIRLILSTKGVSKAGSLTAGDAVAVFARVEGTERYFLEAAKFTAGADGKTLSTTPAVQYPEAKQAVQFYAYFPYHTGTFSVPTDQSTVAALKQADLCWANASSTPVATPVALEFTHKMARLLITTNEPTTKMVFPNAFSGGTLDAATGEFSVGGDRKEVGAAGATLILPEQSLSRLELTVSGVDYVFEPTTAVPLIAGQTTVLHLTLQPTLHTATLSNSSTTDWGIDTGLGTPTTPINNELTLHWLTPHGSYASADKITLTLENPITLVGQEVEAVPRLVAGESSAAACSYRFPVSVAADAGLWYPYRVSRTRIYAGSTLLYDASRGAIKGATIYRSGAQTLALHMFVSLSDGSDWLNASKNGASKTITVGLVGAAEWTAQVLDGGGNVSTDITVTPATGGNGTSVRLAWSPNVTSAAKSNYTIKFFPTGYPDVNAVIKTSQAAGPADGILVNGVLWSKGNLVANGPNGCKIGAPGDGGLYFQFGSLIGYKGGNQANGGTGVGMPQSPLTNNGTYWNGGSWGSFAADAQVWPSEMSTTPSAWPSNNGSSAGDRNTVVDQWFFNFNTAPYSNTEQDIRGFSNSFTGDKGSGNLGTGRYAKWGIGDPCTYYLGGTWRLPTTNEHVALCNNQGGSGWVPWATVGGSWTTSPTYGGNFSSNRLFFPASGYRYGSNGSFGYVTTLGHYWSSSVNDATNGYNLYFYQPNGVIPQFNYSRSTGFPVRCVSSVP